MVEKFAGIYFDKNKHSNKYDEGPHYILTGGGSLRIPDGYAVQFSKNEDGSGGKSRLLYAGGYEDLSCYPNIVGSKRFDVSKVELGPKDFTEAINYIDVGTGTPYPVRFKVPVGQHKAGVGQWWEEKFANDTIDALNIPDGLCVKVYDQADTTYFLDFDGPMVVDLNRFNYANKVSRIDVIRDEWFCIGATADWEKAEILSEEEIAAGFGVISNPSSAKATYEKKIAVRKNSTYTTQWDVRAGASLTVGLTASGGVPFVGEVEVSTEFTVSLEGGYGESETVEQEKSFEETVSVELEANQFAKVTLMLKWVKSRVPVVREWQNKRTGVRTQEIGSLIVAEGVNSFARVEDLSDEKIAA